MTCPAGTVTYWAYEPSKDRPMPPIMVATCCPRAQPAVLVGLIDHTDALDAGDPR
jgi:hypothetical protein